jgi:RNA recognition motif-containing protein
MEENTRVFVSGLPPTLSNAALRKHFATRFDVTDAHVIPKRNFGFVGFKSHTMAKNAVDYFNRTYIRMSKISVEMAKPVRYLLDISDALDVFLPHHAHRQYRSTPILKHVYDPGLKVILSLAGMPQVTLRGFPNVNVNQTVQRIMQNSKNILPPCSRQRGQKLGQMMA